MQNALLNASNHLVGSKLRHAPCLAHSTQCTTCIANCTMHSQYPLTDDTALNYKQWSKMCLMQRHSVYKIIHDAPHRLITQRGFIVSLTVYKMNSDDKANGNDNRSVSSWQLRKWITMTNRGCQFAFVIIAIEQSKLSRVKRWLSTCCCISLVWFSIDKIATPRGFVSVGSSSKILKNYEN